VYALVDCHRARAGSAPRPTRQTSAARAAVKGAKRPTPKGLTALDRLGSGTLSLPKPNRIVPDPAGSCSGNESAFGSTTLNRPHGGSLAMQRVVDLAQSLGV
jgi:hypothetical protein